MVVYTPVQVVIDTNDGELLTMLGRSGDNGFILADRSLKERQSSQLLINYNKVNLMPKLNTSFRRKKIYLIFSKLM